MFCTECGKKLDDDAKFCSGCGKPQKQAGGANAEQIAKSTETEEETRQGEKQQGFFSKLGFGKKDEDEKPEKPHKQGSFSIPDTVDESMEVQSAAISSDGKYLAFYVDSEKGVQIMDTQSKKVIHNINIDDYYEVLAVSPSGNLIVMDDYGTNHSLWDVHKEEQICSISSRCFAFSPDNKRLAYILNEGDYDLEVIKTQDGGKLITINGRENGLVSAKSLAYSHDGRYLASNGIIWDARNGGEVCKLGVSDDDGGETSTPFITKAAVKALKPRPKALIFG